MSLWYQPHLHQPVSGRRLFSRTKRHACACCPTRACPTRRGKGRKWTGSRGKSSPRTMQHQAVSGASLGVPLFSFFFSFAFALVNGAVVPPTKYSVRILTSRKTTSGSLLNVSKHRGPMPQKAACGIGASSTATLGNKMGFDGP